MGKRYYCDYCDRSFKDDPEARRRHLSSLQHVKNRTNHYNLFKDPEVILQEESAKIPCKRYMNVGDCAFGNGCRFSHYTPQMLWELQKIVLAKRQSNSMTTPQNGWPDPTVIMNEFLGEAENLDNLDDSKYPGWTIATEYHNYQHLPPSLWPITPETVDNSNFGKWG